MKLDELHDKLFGLLCMIDDICKKENIPYYLDGGTEIGSVREKDIIPWDDDVDIKVKLEDYPAFKAAMQKNLPDHFHLVEPHQLAPAFFDMMVRIVDDRFLIRKETEEDRFYGNWQNRVGVDVFIQHKIPDGFFSKRLSYCYLKTLYGMGMGHRYKLDYKNYSVIEGFVVGITSSIGRLFPIEKIWQYYYQAIKWLDRRPSTCGMRNTVTWKGIYSTKWTEGTAYGEIRGRRFPISAGYHEELTAYYGDYMRPPEDRSIYIQHLDPEDQFRE